jgi:SAM-dependent methyltransferase
VIVRQSCACCGHDLETVLDLGDSPLANYYPAPGEPDGPRYPLQMAVCGVCWLVQMRHVPDSREIFGDGYGFVTHSPVSGAYSGAAADWCLARAPAGLVIEAGCNDGTLLAAFAARGRQVLGIEPAQAASLADGRGVPVVRELLTRESGGKIAAEHGLASVVVAFHVAAHVPDPDDFLAGIAALLADDGVAVAEFQSLADLVAGGQIDHVYHEHRFFYSLDSFTRFAAAQGLTVTEAVRTPAQGGSIRVVLRRGRLPGADGWRQGEAWLRTWHAYRGLQGRAEYARRRLLEVIDAEQEQGRVVAGYAASAKSCTLLSFCGIGPDSLPWIADTTPGKAGRLAPGSRIPIRPEGDMPDTFLLLAANYLPEILARMPADWRAAGGKLITPLPVPVVF